MSELETQVQIGSGGDAEIITLADLGGVELAQVQANYGFTPTPAGTFHFRVKNAELEPLEIADKSDGAAPDSKVTVPTVLYELEAVNVINLSDKSLNPQEYIGWDHNERFFIKDAAKDLGRCRALMENAGMQMNGTFKDLLLDFIGMEFIAVVTNSRDRNDKDRVYANLNLKKVQPVGGGQQMAAMAAGAETQQQSAPKPAAFSLKK